MSRIKGWLSDMLIGVIAFCAELISVLVSSVTLSRLGSGSSTSASSVTDFIEKEYELEWLATQFNFLVGLMGFAAMVGLRAWVFFACPLFAKIAAGLVASSVLTMLSFTQVQESRSIPAVGARYVTLLAAKAWEKRSVTLALALAVGAASLGGIGLAAVRTVTTPWTELNVIA